jgi:hypothetical protein
MRKNGPGMIRNFRKRAFEYQSEPVNGLLLNIDYKIWHV